MQLRELVCSSRTPLSQRFKQVYSNFELIETDHLLRFRAIIETDHLCYIHVKVVSFQPHELETVIGRGAFHSPLHFLEGRKMGNPKGNPKPQYEGMIPEQRKSAYWKNSYEKHKVKRQAEGRVQAKKYRTENREIVLEKKLDQWLRDNFKRTSEWYVETLLGQNGHCALCDRVPTTRRFQVDHDHDCCPTDKSHRKTCGKCIRGLLCEPCNTDLGRLERTLKDAFFIIKLGKEDSWTAKALRYLAKWKTQEIQTCTRVEPHVCTVNGPCNGWPRTQQ